MPTETILHTTEGWWRPDPATAPWSAEAGAGPQDSRVAFEALVAFTFIMLLAPQSFFPVLKPFRIALLAALLAIGSQLLHRMLGRQPPTRLTREVVLGAVLAAWAVATVPFSYWPSGSMALLMDPYFKASALFWLLANVATTPDRLRRMCWALTVLAVPLALAGIRNFLTREYLPDSLNTRITGYDAALTRNPNDLALMLNLLLPLSAALLGSARTGAARAALSGGLVLDAVAIVLTFSRAGFLTLAMSAAFFLAGLARRGQGKTVVAALVLTAAGLFFLPHGYTDRLATITRIESDRTGSAQARWKDMVSAAGFVLNNPVLGAGAGMDILALNDLRGPEWKLVHNAYLEYAVDLGLPGLTLFLLLLLSCFRTAGAVRRRCGLVGSLRELRDIAHGIQVSLVAFAVAACFHPVAYHFYFFQVAGLAIGARGAYETASGRGLFASKTESLSVSSSTCSQ